MLPMVRSARRSLCGRLVARAAIATALLCPACAVTQAVDTLHYEAPPPELGRPGWVRGAARLGAWLGAAVGAVASIATLPITYPISLLADEPLGYSKTEFLLAPASMGASAGHFGLGAPFDMLDFLFRRAWIGPIADPGYDYVPVKPPAGPLSSPVSGEPEAPPDSMPASQPAGTLPTEVPATQPAGEDQGG
jgi:hypothetical protein